MALDSTSTTAEIEASYMDNASYAEDADLAKAKAFVIACRLLLLKRPKLAGKGGAGGAEMEWDLDQVRQELQDAQQYVAAQSSSGRVLHADLREFRD